MTEESDFRDRVYSTLKELDGAIDLAVAPALGALAAEYAWQTPSRPADEFFRGVLRLLRSITGEELDALRAMCDGLSALDIPKRYEALELIEIAAAPGEEPQLHWRREAEGQVGKAVRAPIGIQSPHHLQLFHLLKDGRLGSDAPGGFWDVMTGPQVLIFPVQNLRRLSAIIGPTPAKNDG